MSKNLSVALKKIRTRKNKKRSLNTVSTWIKSLLKIVHIYLFKTDILVYTFQRQSKIVYLYYSQIRSLKIIKNFDDVGR